MPSERAASGLSAAMRMRRPIGDWRTRKCSTSARIGNRVTISVIVEKPSTSGSWMPGRFTLMPLMPLVSQSNCTSSCGNTMPALMVTKPRWKPWTRSAGSANSSPPTVAATMPMKRPMISGRPCSPTATAKP